MKTLALFVFIFGAALPGYSQTTGPCPDFTGAYTTRIYNTSPASEFGHPRLTPVTSQTPNYVDGHELYQPSALAVDPSSRAIYIVDTGNNRVLGYRDRTSLTKGNAADLVLGQKDLFSTLTNVANQTDFPAGLFAPADATVDASGNVYVVDAGNNRILRYPNPFTHADYTPDLIIGQTTLRSGVSANEGLSTPSAKTLALNIGSGANGGVFLDAAGNLWVSDTYNNRVLRFPASQLAANTVEPVADIVVGQSAFNTNAGPTSASNPFFRTGMFRPGAIAISNSGDLYVADAYSRVLYYKGPVASGRTTADRVLGLPTPTPNAATPTCVNNGDAACSVILNSPAGLALQGNALYVADAGNSRIVVYGSPDTWAPICSADGVTNTAPCATGTTVSPTPVAYVGQVDAVSVAANQGTSFRTQTSGTQDASERTLFLPSALAFDGSNLWVADTLNNRVLMFAAQGGLYSAASKVVGQVDFQYRAPNLADNRGLFLSSGSSAGGGVAIDNSGPVPHMYVADYFNNRVLGFLDARKVKPGASADIIIGQPDQYHTVANYGSSNSVIPTDASLKLPAGVAVDSSGNLWVADAGNGRVLRFPTPFSQNGSYHANLVLGQNGFNANPANSVPSQFTMEIPWAIAFTQNGSVVVSDAGFNRVTAYTKSNGDFQNTQAAAVVFGQSDFTTISSGNSTSKMFAPRGIAIDSSDRLYVADTGNNRVMVFDNVLRPGTHTALFTAGGISAFGMAVSQITGNVFVANAGGAISEFPVLEVWQAQSNPSQPLLNIPDLGPVAMAIDANDNVIAADATNRIASFYTQAAFGNGATIGPAVLNSNLTGGMIAFVCPEAPGAANQTSGFASSNAQWPTTLADTQVLVNGNPAPILYVIQDRIAFQVPNLPADTQIDVQVVKASTGQILSSATAVPLNAAAPAFLLQFQNANPCPSYVNNSGATCVPIAASNKDGSVNSSSNPASRGDYMSLYGTGIGYIPGGPPDGQPAAGPINAPLGTPQVYFNPGSPTTSATVQYFGLVNWAPGVFQLNVQVPQSVAAPPAPPWEVQVVMVYQVPTNNGANGKIYSTVYVK